MFSNRKLNVGLVQIGDSFGGEYYLPYSIGLLQAYAQKYLKTAEVTFKLPVYSRADLAFTVDYLADADIVFFSSYLWNHQLNLKIAQELKVKKNNIIVVFGGPQIPESADTAEGFLRAHPFLDIICCGEGEISFLRILENFQQKLWANVSSIGYIDENNKYKHNLQNERIKDLGEIPSPYLEGVFDLLIKAYPAERWAGLIETNRGCPFSCSYCYWGEKSRSHVYQFEKERIYQEIDWFSKYKIEFIFCCDANFGILERDKEIAEKVAINKELYGYPKAFSIQNTKNSTKKIFMIQKILNDSGLQKGVNLALQSLNPETLMSISRNNISVDVYRELQLIFVKNKIPTFSDMIIGLPNESYNTFICGVCRLIESGQHSRIQFINLTVLENTEISKPQYQKKYGLIIQDSKIISHHTSLDTKFEAYEMQKLVTGTDSMSKEDWIRIRIFCWTISLFYFNKLLHIPFTLIHEIYSVNYRELIEIFMLGSNTYSRICEIRNSLITKARDIQAGGYEYVASKDWLNIWWPIDEYLFIKLCISGSLPLFYEEAEQAISDLLRRKKINFSKKILHDAITLNKSLIKLPFIENNQDITLNYNIWEVYRGILDGSEIKIREGESKYTVERINYKWASWDQWFREVVWYGTKKGAYLYDCNRIS